jgi:alkanesulfonate monooxygenase SsuD/methylene tetrahydromethanopterin reductase-like flavin-dependent oxidoreductase (luciferase family)
VLSNPVAATLHDRHARLVSTLDEIDRLWSPERDEELATFPQPPAPTPMVLGVNSPQLAELAGARCDGLNVRASHEHLADLLAAAMRARASSGRSDRFDVSVWARWDEALFDPRHADRIRWEGLGVNRLILACFDRVDLSALRRATGVTGS